MLTITKINSAKNQAASARGGDYLFYLGSPSTRERSDFAEYVAGNRDLGAPPPFWIGEAAPLLGLHGEAQAQQVERLARGLHPLTGEPLVAGAGESHVMGLDMTFSTPKDFSAVFAAADPRTQTELVDCLHGAAREALGFAATAVLTRHEHGGRVKRVAEATLAAAYTHFASRSLDPQVHLHGFLLNVGKRRGTDEWSALEFRPLFERKLATGALFRAELAWRLRGMGFSIEQDGPYFHIAGISEAQRDALSTRSKEIDRYLKQQGVAEASDSAAREIAALNTRASKSEPPLPELLKRFKAQTAALGLDAAAVMRMRDLAVANGFPTRPEEIPAHASEDRATRAEPEAFAVDHAELLDELMLSQSCATEQEALAAICARAMGQASAADCLRELDRFMACDQIVRLGATEQMTEVFSSKERQALESVIDARVRDGAASRQHSIDRRLVEEEFDALENELRAKLGVPVSLAQQREAALYLACESGRHAFVDGWAGTGKTTLLRVATRAYAAAGFEVLGCCQSAAASQNLGRETGARSRTIASFLLALRSGRVKLGERSVVLLDEAGMVGSREFSLLQEAAINAGAKLVCVGDPKQLQPIEAGGIFASLMRAHGKAELSDIQRQRTDFGPLLDWLDARARAGLGISRKKAQALREVPEEARMAAAESLCSKNEKLARAFAKWKSRFDHEWLRDAIRLFAEGDARAALDLLDSKGRLRIAASPEEARARLVGEWLSDKTPLVQKAMLAGTRAEVAELNRLARERLVASGAVRDDLGLDAEIRHRDGSTETKRFAPGDRLVFLTNDRELGVANGSVGTIASIELGGEDGPQFLVELDGHNERGEREVRAPVGFACFDLAYCLTNHKAQGRTFDAAYALANPNMVDREWTYVAASRSRFSTTLFVDASALGLTDPESHLSRADKAASREAVIDALAGRMSRSRAKGTTLDYARAPGMERPPVGGRERAHGPRAKAASRPGAAERSSRERGTWPQSRPTGREAHKGTMPISGSTPRPARAPLPAGRGGQPSSECPASAPRWNVSLDAPEAERDHGMEQDGPKR
ncbi:MAG: MobF family relaxase [Paraburkholderia fungorum]